MVFGFGRKGTKVGFTAPGEAEPEGEHGGCDGLRVLIGRRGFCLHKPDGSRAYASVADVHAQLRRAAVGAPCQPGHKDARLQTAAATHLKAIDAVVAKIGAGGIDDAEAARQIMVIVGPPMHLAVAMALPKDTTERVGRARAASAHEARKASVLASQQARKASAAAKGPALGGGIVKRQSVGKRRASAAGRLSSVAQEPSSRASAAAKPTSRASNASAARASAAGSSRASARSSRASTAAASPKAAGPKAGGRPALGRKRSSTGLSAALGPLAID